MLLDRFIALACLGVATCIACAPPQDPRPPTGPNARAPASSITSVESSASAVAAVASGAPLPSARRACPTQLAGEPLAFISAPSLHNESDIAQMRSLSQALAKVASAKHCPTCAVRTACELVRTDGLVFSAFCHGRNASRDPTHDFGFWPATFVRQQGGYQLVDLPQLMGVSTAQQAIVLFNERARAHDSRDFGIEDDQYVGLLIDATALLAVEAAPGKVYLPRKSPLPFPVALALGDKDCDPYALPESVGDDQPDAIDQCLGFGFDGDAHFNGRPRFSSVSRPATARAISAEIEREFGPFSNEADQISCEVQAISPRFVGIVCPRYGNTGINGALAFNYALGADGPRRLRGKDAFAPTAAQRKAIATKCLQHLLRPQGELPAQLTALPDVTADDLDAFGVEEGRVTLYLRYRGGADPRYERCAFGLEELAATPALRGALK